MYTNLFCLWLVVLICMVTYFIECNSYQISLFLFLFLACYCGIIVILYLDAGSPQHLYQGIQKYVMTFLMNLPWSKPSYTLVPNIICIVLYRNMCMVSIKEYIIQNPPYQSSGPMLVILSISNNMEFGVTREVLSIGPQRICPGNRYK